MNRWVLAFLMLLLGLVLGVGIGFELPRPVPVGAPAAKPIQGVRPLSGQQLEQSLVARGDFSELAMLPAMDLRRFRALIADLPVARQRIALQLWGHQHGDSFESLIARAHLAGADADWAGAIELLLTAAPHVRSAGDEMRLVEALATATTRYARTLIAADRLDALDALYERITLTLPELAEYHMKLGELRIRVGRFDDALAPLAQIQHHTRLGAQARELLAQAEASEAFEAGSLEQLPLRTAGSQYIVDAVIDDGTRVALLIDTGAAMTILDARVLASLGYDLAGPQAYFRTANGVIEAPVVTLLRLSLGGSGINQLPVGALDLDMPTGIDGLLGMNFLRHFEFRIDQESVVLHLQTAR